MQWSMFMRVMHELSIRTALVGLSRACASEGGGEDGANAVKRGTQLVEICALQILMHSQQRDQKRLRCVCVCVRVCGE